MATFAIKDTIYILKREDNPSLYDMMLEHHKRTIIGINVKVVNIAGEITKVYLPPGPILSHLEPLFPSVKYKFLYDGYAIEPTDTSNSKRIHDGDFIDAIKI